jgi:pre-mRNA-splicing factor ATP-dependent RNA helicase DHX38/PRP16
MDPPPQETILNAMYQLWILGALDSQGRLTSTGKKMAEFPLDPPLSKILLVSAELGCSKEALIIVSMLSVPAIFFRPKETEHVADMQRQKLMVPESDHLTLYNVYRCWKESGRSAEWSRKFFVHQKSLRKVREIKKQLQDILKSIGISLTSCNGKLDVVRKAICAGYFINAARIKSIGEYFNLRTGLPFRVHPSSALFCMGYIPDYVVYHEVILTSREYIHTVTAVDPHWLAELGPMFFVLKESIGEEKMKMRYYKGDREWEESKLDEVGRKLGDQALVAGDGTSAYPSMRKKDGGSVVRFGSKATGSALWKKF